MDGIAGVGGMSEAASEDCSASSNANFSMSCQTYGPIQSIVGGRGNTLPLETLN